MELQSTTVLVTGGSRGIGAAIVKSLSNAGANVILHFNQNESAAELVAQQCGPNKCTLVQADLSIPGSALELWEKAQAACGNSINVLVNNAAIMPSAGIEDDWSQWNTVWRDVMQTNVVACADLCRLAINDFRKIGGGRIINIASRAGHRGDAPDYLHYGASKGALLALTRGIARGFAHENILAFAIAPGFTKTEMARSFIANYGEAAATKDIPLGELVNPEEIAELVLFLANKKVKSLTGATLDVNGASYVR